MLVIKSGLPGLDPIGEFKKIIAGWVGTSKATARLRPNAVPWLRLILASLFL